MPRLLLAALAAALLLPPAASARPGDLDRSFGKDGRARAAGTGYLELLRTGARGRIIYSTGQSVAALDRRGRRAGGFAATHPGQPVVTRGGVAVVQELHNTGVPFRWTVERFDRRGRAVRGPVEIQGMPEVRSGLSAVLPARGDELLAVLTSVENDGFPTVVIQRIGADDTPQGAATVLPGVRPGRSAGIHGGRSFIELAGLALSRADDRLAGIDPLGSPLAEFTAPAPATGATTIAPLRDGGVWVGEGAGPARVIRYGPTGTVERVLRVPGMPVALAVDRRGRLLVGLTGHSAPATTRSTVRRYTRSGRLDRRFGKRGVVRLPVRRGSTGVFVTSLLTDRAGRVIVALDDVRAGGPSGVEFGPSIARLRG